MMTNCSFVGELTLKYWVHVCVSVYSHWPSGLCIRLLAPGSRTVLCCCPHDEWTQQRKEKQGLFTQVLPQGASAD